MTITLDTLELIVSKGTSWENQRMNNPNRIAWAARKYLSPQTRDQVLAMCFPPPPGYGAASQSEPEPTPTATPARKPIDTSTRLLRQDGVDKMNGKWVLLFKVGGSEQWVPLPRPALIELANNKSIELTEIFSRLGDGVRYDRAWLRGWFERHAPALVAAFDSEVPNHA